VESAQYAARRAEKQYDTTDPDHRLVAGELERRWNAQHCEREEGTRMHDGVRQQPEAEDLQRNITPAAKENAAR
jgi:hypothetical protein